jgi:hypothetical protein
MRTITTTEAEARSLRPLINPCTEAENWIVENVCADMRRGGIDHAIVETPQGLEVWRSNYGFKKASK